MQTFTFLFLTALSVALATQLWLARRQIQCVRKHRDIVPTAFAHRITIDSHRKAADYTISRTHLEMAAVVYHGIVLLAWSLGQGIAFVDEAWRALVPQPVLAGAGTIFTVLFLSALLELPLSLYRTFVIEQRFGFNRTTARVFAGDMVKEALLSVALGLPLVLAVLWLMGRDGSMVATYWWFFVWLSWLGFSLFVSWIYPVAIAPLFNRFTPLDIAELRTRIESLLARTGFRSKGIFVVDGSRRSSHGNAYFTGFGRFKRIVFFDTLLEKLTGDEIEAVLAHELGHYARHHVRTHWIMTALISLAGLYLLGWLETQPWFFRGLGVTAPTPQSALLLFLMCGPVFAYLLTPLLLNVSRRHEFEADRFAARHTGGAKLRDALMKVYDDNASTLTPDPWYSRFHDSHPNAAVRIAALQGAAP